MKTFLFPYMKGSKGAKALAAALGIKRIKLENSKFKPNANKLVINWGSSKIPANYEKCKEVLNFSVGKVSNKLTFFNMIHDKPYCIPYASTLEWATELFSKKGDKVVCRTILNGHSGNGIIIANSPDELVECKLYTKYIPKKEEYRIHVFEGKSFWVQRKARKREVEDNNVNWQVRNNKNGFVYQATDVVVPPSVIECAEDVVTTCNLKFGAVDVIWNDKTQKAYVLEINSAPGLHGRTLEAYKERFGKWLKGFL